MHLPSIICYAISTLLQLNQKATIYEMLEGDLKKLPQPSVDVLKKMGNVNIVSTNMQLDKKHLLKIIVCIQKIHAICSPTWDKALCNCEILKLIQGVHI